MAINWPVCAGGDVSYPAFAVYGIGTIAGLSDRRILIKHALPNVAWPPVIVNAAFGGRSGGSGGKCVIFSGIRAWIGPGDVGER